MCIYCLCKMHIASAKLEKYYSRLSSWTKVQEWSHIKSYDFLTNLRAFLGVWRVGEIFIHSIRWLYPDMFYCCKKSYLMSLFHWKSNVYYKINANLSKNGTLRLHLVTWTVHRPPVRHSPCWKNLAVLFNDPYLMKYNNNQEVARFSTFLSKFLHASFGAAVNLWRNSFPCWKVENMG